ncbi:hypothetical protein M2480_001566 [Parabacteroides sp. PFB2-12]|uniref:hypothetical protein n=1 Tax=unclassified Parabacteroides TaxID=2649774 RepID=UPI002474FB09|nr:MULTISPECIES: hypothetical protein [unclassified Parabacteroides]MDH6342248.1 hypothetical protein [Parabacteroides sp. PM6-13]MDH6390591.1 hypothetical protein [Parabacteroides sp. PFB2-12]
MIKIGKPRIEPNGNSLTRLVSDIFVDGEKKTVWAEVDNRYKDYLCDERSDAFVIGILHYAMKNNHDIICEAPMGESLYYQITTYLIDSFSKANPRMYAIRLEADVDEEELPCGSGVGTGISCGIDSLHVLASHTNTKMKKHNITHLTFFNVGSHGEGERATQLFEARKQQAKAFSQEYGFDFVEVNSNIMDMFQQEHFVTHTFTSMFAVFVLQKLYATYYYASSHSFFEFSVRNMSTISPGYGELLVLDMFSTENLRLYSEGGTLSRLEKTQEVSKYAPSYKYLNVCTMTATNCGRCEKCTRTLLALDILGRLDYYNAMFDIDYYKRHKQQYLKTLVAKCITHNDTYLEMYPYLKKQITLFTYISSIPVVFKEWAILHIPSGGFKDFLKKMYQVGKRKV